MLAVTKVGKFRVNVLAARLKFELVEYFVAPYRDCRKLKLPGA
jgi:hypothetical protein